MIEPLDDLEEDNIHYVLAESAGEEPAALWDNWPNDVPAPDFDDDDNLREVMNDSVEETIKEQEGEPSTIHALPKACQTFFMPKIIKEKFEEICKNNYTTPSCFLRNICIRLVESYYGKRIL
jgi:hypothetical protein